MTEKQINTEKFTFFWGRSNPNGVFSQWYVSPFQVDGVWYNTAEQYMMAEKARMFSDDENLARILASPYPSDQKRYGRLVVGFDKTEWEKIAKDVVYRGNYAKFSQNPELKKALLATAGTTLVEASPKDCIWGIGLSKEDTRALSRATWLGTNWLGEVLTRVREDLLRVQSL